MEQQLRGTILVLVSACCFGTISVFTLIATGAGATLPGAMVARYGIAVIVLLLLTRGRALREPRARVWRLIAVGGIGQLCVNGFGLAALRYVPAATAGFLFYTFPAWITLWAALRGTERLDVPRVLALLLALGGVALMVGNPLQGEIDLRGVVLALAAAVSYAVYVPSINRAQREVAPVAAATWIAMSAGSAFLLAGLVQGAALLPTHPHAWLAMAGAGILATVMGFLFFLQGLKILGPVRTAITSTIEPFFTAVLAALVLSQELKAMTIVGGVLIAGAVVLLQRRRSEAV